MKKSLLLFALLATVAIAGAQPNVDVFTENLKFCEGTTPYKGMMLVSNFGCDELDPLNNKGKGYIAAFDEEGFRKIFIKNDGYLSAPKGMRVVNNRLFIADVNKVVVYDLERVNYSTPTVVEMPAGEAFVNDITNIGDLVIVSVTNTGNIYGINAPKGSIGKPQLLGSVTGANGMVVNGNMLYVASYNPSGKPDESNVIYSIDLTAAQPQAEKLIPNLPMGMYDGIALSEDGETLYFTSWIGGAKGKGALYKWKVDGSEKYQLIDIGFDLSGPADISIKDGFLYLPDLVESRLYKIEL
ncbi:Putative periplasmic ATP/GTP-binding protein [Mucinivorans hirudinis]|uniref:Putative periplasmic ATP/GTP-binding protein n=1 Tax=Mucinivorans hirudinis TaxID=1433126 RepID=A0A060RCI3_9BACT|nr:Putative periplasmic ATP/GTP-binding protein [Mucinivorans hirudinis]